MGKASIIKAIQKHKPASLPLPAIDTSRFYESVDVLETFKQNVQRVGGAIVEAGTQTLDEYVAKQYSKAEQIVDLLEGSSLGNKSLTRDTDPHSLEHVDLAIIPGSVGVAENGAVWVSEDQFIIRALPFITNDLILVLSKKDICLHMLDAYDQIDQRERSFGLFLSGPSKTADIEQCLVIGAQGAMSLTVFLI